MNKKDQTLFALRLMSAVSLAFVLLVVGWPVVFVPGLWERYTAWESDTNNL